MKDAEIERSNKLLSLISYDQESGFIKNMAIIESNNNQYLAVGDHQTVWSGSRGSGVWC